jgi:hypothetical protein
MQTTEVCNPYCIVDDPITAAQRECMVREAAYYLAEHRGFVCGHELDDWLMAEKLIDATSADRQRS